jgi:TAG lipase/steryl ester hydrolase/phospholipase A2/LPA acyltransferase
LIIKTHPFRNIGNILNPKLYEKSYLGTKNLILEFLEEYETCFRLVQECSLPLHTRIKFFRETRHVFGKTALILSGGGLLGMYHLGVIRTLYDQNLLPSIVSGSSSGNFHTFLYVLGSVIAGVFFTRTLKEIGESLIDDDSLLNYEAFQDNKVGNLFTRLKRYFKTGLYLDIKNVEQAMKQNIGNITFMEAYQKTGFALNITVTAENDNG